MGWNAFFCTHFSKIGCSKYRWAILNSSFGSYPDFFSSEKTKLSIFPVSLITMCFNVDFISWCTIKQAILDSVYPDPLDIKKFQE